MATPRNWTKLEENLWAYDNAEYSADHIEAKIEKGIGRASDDEWGAIVSTFNHGMKYDESFSNKEEARKSLMQWMRGHPFAFKKPYLKSVSSHGVGGSYTAWQGKPPAHVQYRFETSYGTLSANFYSRDGESIAGIKTQSSSEVEFQGLSPDEKDEIREIAKSLIKHDDFFSD